MRILLVIDSLGSGGAQRLYAHLAKALSQAGHQVEVFIYVAENQFYKDDFHEAGIKIHIAEKDKPSFSWRVVEQLRAVIRTGYDGIISAMHAPSVYAALAKIGIAQGKLVVCEVSSSAAPVPWIRKGLFYLAALMSDSVVANSYSEAGIMRGQIGLSRKVTAIWNGYDVDATEFHPYQGKMKLKQLLVVGRIAYPKNAVNLLRGLLLFYSRNSWMPQVLWAGRRDLDQRSRQMQVEMDAFLEAHPQVADSFHMLGEVKNIDELYQTSDALLHVSLYEGLPNVICEAMMLGCPVIASNVCDHQLLAAEERGLLCDPFSPQSICDAIERFSNLSLEKRSEMALKSRKFSEEEFDISRMVNQFEMLLK